MAGTLAIQAGTRLAVPRIRGVQGTPGLDLLIFSPAVPRGTGPDVGRFFEGVDATFVLLDAGTGRTVRHGAARAAERLLPASTCKIPNTVIALETGVAPGAEFALPWDASVAPLRPWRPETWARDQTLRTALRDSVVWYYQEIARRVGPERMKSWVDRLDYGNRDLSGGIDRFWLSGGLRISADEQVWFLSRLRGGELGGSPRILALLDEMLLLEETPSWRLYGKMETTRLGKSDELRWLVGWVQRGDSLFYYPLNVEGPADSVAWAQARRAGVVRGILQALGVLPS